MRNISNKLTALPLATAVTMGSFYLMAEMADFDQDTVIDPPKFIKIVDTTFSPEEQIPIIEEPKIVPPPEVVTPPPPPPVCEGECKHKALDFVPHVPQDGPVLPEAEMYKPHMSDGENVILVAVAPRYPERQARLGIEGYSIVSFSIDENGIVFNPSILTSTPSGAFEKESLRTIKLFKFKPRVLNGQRQVVHNARYKFLYQMKE